MALPIIETPTYTCTQPSKPQVKISYRPFLVSEEKVLLMAQETGDPLAMMEAMKAVVSVCTFGKVDPDKLTSFDLEFIFLKLREKSVGETATIVIPCSECKQGIEVDVDLEQVTVDVDHSVNKKIQLTPNVGITLKHIDVASMIVLSDPKLSKADAITEAVIASIETIFDSEQVHLPERISKAELYTFVNSMNRTQMAQVEDFIAKTPKLSHTVECTCPKCKAPNTRVLQGIQSFFG
jgi:hypothetical protein